MATRVVEGRRPYTGGKAITVDENRVISLNLRGENNLIIWDEGDNEIYVDLQIPDGRTPIDAFPIGVNTGRVSSEDGWDVTGTIISAETTSGDNIKILYGDDGTLWIDNGTGTFKQIYFKGDVDSLLQDLRTYIDGQLALKQDGVTSDTAPTDPTEGMLWYDTTTSKLKVYDGTQWNEVGTGGGGTGDVVGPSSATDGHLALFDGITGKLIKDGGAVPTVPTNVSSFNNDAGYITGLIVLSYGTSTWNDFITAYNSNSIIYCRVGQSVPGTSPQNYLAVMRYVDDTTTPTEVEFMRYISRVSHDTDATQVDECAIYTLNNQGTWSVSRRNISSLIVAGTNMTSSYNSGILTLNATGGGGDVVVSSDANNTLTTGAGLWAGTEANYQNISTPDINTLYFTF